MKSTIDWVRWFHETPGLMAPEDALFLHGLALIAISGHPGRGAAELGTLHGKSAIAIGAACDICNVSLACVDSWSYEDAEEKIAVRNIAQAGLSHCVNIVTGHITTVGLNWKGGPLAFIFHDGCHQKPSIINDTDSWWGWIEPGGIMAFHDVWKAETNEGVIDRMAHYEAEYLGRVGVTAAYRKVK